MIIQFDQLTNVPMKNIYGPKSQHVSHLCFHSKRAKESSVFFSMKGKEKDGHHYIEEAIERGAVAVFGSNPDNIIPFAEKYPACTFLLVDDVRRAMACFSKFYYQNSDEKIRTIGVTGTNGKTTVAAYVKSLLTLLGLPTGSIGTTGIESSRKKLVYKKSTPTTPESLDLHHIFNDFYKLEDGAAVMEVSSIAIDQQRVDGIRFDTAIHTNISEEHLEYHGTFEHYLECKLKLFDQAETAVINLDDSVMGEELNRTFKGSKVTYSLSPDSPADIKAGNIETTASGTAFDLYVGGAVLKVTVPVFGDYNVANILSAIGTAMLQGYKIEEIVSALPEVKGPEGRFEIIEGPDRQRVILDYAHTPVALAKLVKEVKKLEYDRLIVMIAGIGIRDFNKMPKMAETIEGKADEIVVTVDHPGYNEPVEIIDQVMTGFDTPEAPNIHTTLTRKEGILQSLKLGGPTDIILLTSGCINGAQLVKGEEVPHSDREIIENFFRLTSYKDSSGQSCVS
ncbi:UDP-N-acetylmuramoyl-L-alanyl-D-glutamate--2,6-diaminopimelate ligase [Pseudalkalibacillus caeni]|uniref:UDP-N-acetylmuramyl-tripeptide synthetase n=1 Tax=Exobacillus caeni TaxID=2574798 RepID=A0A5R9FBM5_9BACL|nr:UDP-N-acetylmuramoyl-L-alanyl-D-glutamate--2,6-diaminopimelate ligase [Pseudalkalibacillus caeni]TLS37025.1 UDP-N-acetylmuramoyl-L-alanyl-D-glutamate--2,6-diaminopimelate ligase [Pseudalkalibacillus caeni]